MVAQYNNAHRLFLQVFIAKNLLSEEDCRDVYLKVAERMEVDAPVDGLSSFIRQVNDKLSPLSMEIRIGREEATGQAYYALVNTLEDDAAKLATDFTPSEMEYVKKIIEAIIVSAEGSCVSIDLMNMGYDLQKKVSAHDAEVLITTMVNRRWLSENRGEISFGARALIELGQYLESKFPDHVSDCLMCHSVVVMGDCCDECGKKLHKYCAATRFQAVPAEKRKCPSCDALWDQPLITLHKTNNNNNNNNKNNNNKNMNGNNNKSINGNNNTNNSVCVDDEDEAPPSRRRSRR